MSLIRADAINIPLQDGTVDLVVTSPPYFSLRSYTDGGEHYDGQIGRHFAKTVTRTNGERRGAGRGDLVNLPAAVGDDQLDLFGGAA